MKSLLALVVIVSAACSNSPAAPTAAQPTKAGVRNALAALVGVTYVGTETAAHGESGALRVAFTQHPSPGADVEAEITWTGGRSSVSYAGRVAGALNHLTIEADSISPAYGCTYNVVGQIMDPSTNPGGDDHRIEGTYTASGPGGTCPLKMGTFKIHEEGREE